MADSKSNQAPAAEREKALGLVLNQIERNFGKGSIMRLGDASRMRVETISTGALTLDRRLEAATPKAVSLRFTDRRAPVKPRSPCTPLLRCRRVAA